MRDLRPRRGAGNILHSCFTLNGYYLQICIHTKSIIWVQSGQIITLNMNLFETYPYSTDSITLLNGRKALIHD